MGSGANLQCGILLLGGLLTASPLFGQAAHSPANSSDPQVPAGTIKQLLDSVRDLQAQVRELNAHLTAVTEAQSESTAEANQLRHELQLATERIRLLEGPAKPGTAPVSGYEAVQSQPPAAPPVSVGLRGSSQNESLDEQISRLEEKTDLLDAKISDQYQTKVESGSKYRLRLSGIFLLNLYGNTGALDNQDFPEFAQELQPGASDRAFGGSLRQSQINLEGFGPDLAGAHTSASLHFDFAGNTLQEPNGALLGGVRLRTGTFRMDWTNTSVVAGQDSLFFVPLSPTSLASLAVPALSYSGNLWGWTPQVRVEHRIPLSQDSELHFAAGILDQITGDTPDAGQDRAPSWGEQSGQPGYAAHIGWLKKTATGNWSLGAGGYYGRQYWGLNRGVDSWAATVDLLVPLTHRLDFSAAYYRGRAVGGFGGAIGQSVLFNGDPGLSTTAIYGLNSRGGWAQLTYKPTDAFRINAAFGQDNPFASQIRMFPVVPSAYPEPLLKNQSWFVNGIYQFRSNILVSLEFRRFTTHDTGPDAYFANSANLSLGYIF